MIEPFPAVLGCVGPLNGSHVFSKTLTEHNRNVDRWQKQYWRERWARERAEQPDAG